MPTSEAQIAQVLNLSRADVHGVVSFYHDFNAKAGPAPRGADLPRRGLQGARRRGADRRRRAGRAASASSFSTVYCLGLCSAGPVGAPLGD